MLFVHLQLELNKRVPLCGSLSEYTFHSQTQPLSCSWLATDGSEGDKAILIDHQAIKHVALLSHTERLGVVPTATA